LAKFLEPQTILDLLEAGNLEQLIGVAEDDRFEAKGQPYHLEKDRGKLELAKDVSAYANRGGGLILIGAETERSEEHLGDEVVRFHQFKQSLVDAERYQDIIGTWIYPEPAGVRIVWFPAGSPEAAVGVVAIEVPKQDQTRRPFLIRHSLVDEKRADLVFGYVERRRAHVEPYGVEDLHALLKDGLRFDEVIRGRLDSISDAIQDLQAPRQDRQPIPHEEVTHRLIETAKETGLAKGPIFALTASPLNSVSIEGLFGQNTPTVRTIDNPPTLRFGGFGLLHEITSRIVKGQSRRASVAGYKVHEAWRDGTILFAAQALDFLSWWSHPPQNGALRINPLVLCESTFLFCTFSELVLAQARPHPDEVEYGMILENLVVNGQPAELLPGPLTSFPTREIVKAPASGLRAWNRSNRAQSAPDPGKIAYWMLCEVYRWFGQPDDEIPYSKRSAEGEAWIDSELIKTRP
jgi:hypothetical protein